MSDPVYNVTHELGRTSLADLPLDVLAYITAQISLECTLKLGQTAKFFNSRSRAREQEFMVLLQREYYFCYLFKNIIDTHAATMTSSLKAYQNKSWFSLYILASSLFQKEIQPQEKTKVFFPANEVEEEGVNIVHEVVYDDSAPLAYAEANPNKQLKAATINLFIQKIIMGEVDPVYQTSLCSSFECVIDLNSLLEIIIYKFYHFSPFNSDDPNLASKKAGLGQSVLVLLRRLIVRRADAFRAEHLRTVESFAKEITGHEVWGAQALLIWKALAQELVKLIAHRAPNIKVEGPVKQIPLLERSPKVLAQQLSLFMFRPYCDITVSNLFESNKPSGAWKVFVDYFNRISAWASACILNATKIKERVKVYQFFVELAKNLYSHNDYHSLSAILSALNSGAVFRLKHTRAELSNKCTAELQKLDEIINNNSQNSKAFRSILANTEPPCLPFLGIYYRDMSHVMDGNPSQIQKDSGEILINIWKLKLCNKIISDALVFQNTKYSFAEDKEMQGYIWQEIISKSYLDHTLFAISVKIEPRGCSRAEVE